MADNNNNQVVEVNNQIANKDVLPPDISQRIDEAKRQNTALMAMMDNLLEEGIDYGRVPGVSKPFLHQPGAQQLGLVFKFRPEFEVVNSTTDFSQEPIFISYEVKCKLYQRDSGLFLGEGVGSCNNYERKYRYYKDGIEYDDPLDRQNTYLKMAKKRAYVDATLNVTGATRLFTQDPDMVDNYNSNNNSGGNSKVEVLEDPGEYIVPFGYSKGEKLKDCNESTLKWAAGLNPNNTAGKALKQNAIKYMEMQKGNSTNNNSDGSLSDRQKEVTNIIGDNEDKEKDVLDFLNFNDVEKVDELSDEKYSELLDLLRHIGSNDEKDLSDIDPEEFDLPF